CTHNATIKSFELYLDLAWSMGDTTITFVIFEKLGADITNIFQKQISADNDNVSAKYYSTGDISVNIDSGKNYVLGAMWNQNARYYYVRSTGQVVNFGSVIQALGKENLSGVPTSLDPSPAYSFRMAVTSILR
ncbi:MAG TPA: hypothetical protein PKV35_07515, partial [bacterium]|nr:hypothetical protein [bacterium]